LSPRVGNVSKSEWSERPSALAKRFSLHTISPPSELCSARANREGYADGEEVDSWGPSTFVLYDETGQPCVMFGYGTHDEAMTARQYIMAALIGAETVSGLRKSVLED
jgi:hypothetical protein